MKPMGVVVAGELVNYKKKVWAVKRVWDTNTEGFRLDLLRTNDAGKVERLSVQRTEVRVIG